MGQISDNQFSMSPDISWSDGFIEQQGDYGKIAYCSAKKPKMEFYQWRWRREWRPSLSVISAAFIALGRSCLLANTSKTASLSSSWNQIQAQHFNPSSNISSNRSPWSYLTNKKYDYMIWLDKIVSPKSHLSENKNK